MKIKILSLVILFSLTITNSVFALTKADIDLLFAAGFISNEKYELAMSAVSTSGGSTTTSSYASTQAGCLNLSSDLSNGMSGNLVASLQAFLKSQSYFTGEITGFFGSITQESVSKFQIAQGIVLNGTPETTGLGNVGPATRSAIQKISCANSTSSSSSSTSSSTDFFGYNLDELLNNYQIDTNYTADFGYQTDLNYKADLNYQSNAGYTADINDYDADLNDYDSGVSSYRADTSYNANTGYNSGSKDVLVQLFVKALNGQFLRGGNKLPVAVRGSTAELEWDTLNAGSCTLTGDFKERSLPVPVKASATLTLTNPSKATADNFPLYQFKVSCYATSTGYVLPGSDTALIWVAPASTTPQ